MLSFRQKRVAGFSLLEVLITAAIIVILATLLYLMVPRYLQRARDAKRKADMHRFRTVMEEYFTDKRTYPPEDIMDDDSDCGSDNLDPYMDRLLCDPVFKTHYRYDVSDDGLHYWLYTNLQDVSDPEITGRGCGNGCGPDDDDNGAGDYNYGVSSIQVVAGEFSDSTTFSPPNCPWGCTANQCGTCCPGADQRCNAQGTACYTDVACQ